MVSRKQNERERESENEVTVHAVIPMWHCEWYVGDVNTVVVKIYECITFELHTNKREWASAVPCGMCAVSFALNALIVLFSFCGAFKHFHATHSANMLRTLKFNNKKPGAATLTTGILMCALNSSRAKVRNRIVWRCCYSIVMIWLETVLFWYNAFATLTDEPKWETVIKIEQKIELSTLNRVRQRLILFSFEKCLNKCFYFLLRSSVSNSHFQLATATDFPI